MRVTSRDNFRVVALLRNVRAKEFDRHLDGWLVGDGVELVFHPRNPGDLGSMRFPDTWVTRDKEKYAEQACRAMARELEELPYVRSVDVRWDEEYTCSHCKLMWEEIDQRYMDRYPEDIEPGHRVGTPLCCQKAQDEWTEDNHIFCSHFTGGTDSPPEYCEEESVPGDEYCTRHLAQIAREEPEESPTG